jgi:RNA polymerase sigma-70 factor (ECF subfamily)
LIGAGVSTDGVDLFAEGAFAHRLEPLLPVAFRLAYAMLRHRDDAEDAVQDAAAQAWRKRSTFRAGSELRPWFLAIVANECRMTRRRNRRLSVAPLIEAVDDTSGAEADALRRALARLDMDSRLVLVLRFYLDLRFEEVGRTLGISAGAARVRVHRALRKLRPVVEVEEGSGDE